MNLNQYKLMMGVLGNTFLTERMFHAMDKDKDELIDLEEYLTYNDVISYGSTREKREQNFNMLNDNKDSVVTYDEFKGFVIQILDMYSRTASEKINASEGMIRDIFDKIANKDPESFTFDEYIKALEKNPNLFIWLERPKEMVNDFLSEQEGQYSKKFVDETLDYLFRYIKTTEYAMKKIITYIREFKGEASEGNDSEIASQSVHTLDLNDILTDLGEEPKAPENYLLELDPTKSRSKVRSLFSRKREAYQDIVKVLTGELSPEPSKSPKRRKDREEEKKTAATQKRYQAEAESDYEGGLSEEEDSEDESEDDLNTQNDSHTPEKFGKRQGSIMDFFEDNHQNHHFGKRLTENHGTPLDNVEHVCK